jgi:hypothetical protein
VAARPSVRRAIAAQGAGPRGLPALAAAADAGHLDNQRARADLDEAGAVSLPRPVHMEHPRRDTKWQCRMTARQGSRKKDLGKALVHMLKTSRGRLF